MAAFLVILVLLWVFLTKICATPNLSPCSVSQSGSWSILQTRAGRGWVRHMFGRRSGMLCVLSLIYILRSNLIDKVLYSAPQYRLTLGSSCVKHFKLTLKLEALSNAKFSKPVMYRRLFPVGLGKHKFLRLGENSQFKSQWTWTIWPFLHPPPPSSCP